MSAVAAAAEGSDKRQKPAEKKQSFSSPRRNNEAGKQWTIDTLAEAVLNLIASTPQTLCSDVTALTDAIGANLWLFVLGCPDWTSMHNLPSRTTLAERLQHIQTAGTPIMNPLADEYLKLGVTLTVHDSFREHHPCRDVYALFGAGSDETKKLLSYCTGPTCPLFAFPQRCCAEFLFFGRCNSEHCGEHFARQPHNAMHVVRASDALNGCVLYAHKVFDSLVYDLSTLDAPLLTRLFKLQAPGHKASDALNKRIAEHTATRKKARAASAHVSQELGVAQYEEEILHTHAARKNKLTRLRSLLNPR